MARLYACFCAGGIFVYLFADNCHFPRYLYQIVGALSEFCLGGGHVMRCCAGINTCTLPKSQASEPQ
jgi:hypothetical protein